MNETTKLFRLKLLSQYYKDCNWETEKRRYADEDIRHLYFDERLSKSDIARKLGIANSTVGRTFKRNGWEILPLPKKGDPEEARRLYEQGLTHKEIAKKLEISRRTAGKYLEELGVKSKRRSKYKSDAEKKCAKKEQARKRCSIVQELRDKLFGTECRVCGVDRDKRKIIIHNRNFVEHGINALWNLSFLKTLDPEEWSALCVMCHRGVHWANSQLGMDWQAVEDRVKQKTLEESKRKISTQSQDEQFASDKGGSLHNLEGEVKDIRRALFGDECYFCGTIPEGKKLVIHRKNGAPHRGSLLWSKERLRGLKPEEWIASCTKHHRYVHWAMKNLGLKWDDIDSALLRTRR